MNTTSITLDKGLKARLDSLKVHRRESYNDVIERLLSRQGDKSAEADSLIETIEILSDAEFLRSLARSLDDMRKGRTYSIDEV